MTIDELRMRSTSGQRGAAQETGGAGEAEELPRSPLLLRSRTTGKGPPCIGGDLITTIDLRLALKASLLLRSEADPIVPEHVLPR